MLAPEEQEAELREEVERLRLTAIPKALEFQEYKNGILFRIEARFEARYRHWAAQAIERSQSRTLARPSAPNDMPALTEKEEVLNPGGLPTETAPGIVPNTDEIDGRRPVRGHGPATAQSSVIAGTPGAGGSPEPEQDTAVEPPQQITELRLNSGMRRENPPHEPAARLRRYGFKAKMDLHVAISEIIGRYDARSKEGSTGWRKDSTLVRICADLDQGEIQIPATWKKGTTASLKRLPIKDWTDALELGYKKLVTDQLRYSLKMLRTRFHARAAE